MFSNVSRRNFLKTSTASALGLTLTGGIPGLSRAEPVRPVRIGIVGTGGRGRGLMRYLLKIGGADFRALCDIDTDNLAQAQAMITDAGLPKADEYTQGDEAYKRLMDRDDIEAVIIAAPWNWHTPMAVYAMRAGKYAGVEVPVAITLDEC